jgi:hypothetical protein
MKCALTAGKTLNKNPGVFIYEYTHFNLRLDDFRFSIEFMPVSLLPSLLGEGPGVGLE